MAAFDVSTYSQYVSLQNVSASGDPASAPDGGIYLFASGTAGSAKLYLMQEGASSPLDLGAGGDIDSLSALGGTGLHQTQDFFQFSDNGTEKKISFSNLEDAIFGNVSGDIAIAAGGAATIQAGAVEHGMLAEDIISGQAALGGASVAQADLLMLDDGPGTVKKVTFSNFEDSIFGNVSGDATVAAGGALTIAAGAVENSMLADDAVGADELAANAVVNASIAAGAAIDLNKLDGGSADNSLSDLAQGDLLYAGDVDDSNEIKSITFSNLEDAIFGNVSGDATIAAGGALTLAANSVSQVQLDDDAVGADELAANAVVEASIVDNAVTLAKMAGITRGSIILGDSSGDPSLLAKGTAAQFLQSDGTDPSYVTISGDATVAAGGALTIAAGAVENSMLADDAVGADELAANAVVNASVASNAAIAASKIDFNVDLGGNVTFGSQSDDVITLGGGLTVGGDLTVQGTTTTVDSTTIHISSSFTFEGPTDAHETTLGVVDPTADATINLPAMSAGTYFLPVLSAVSTTAISATPAELNLLDAGVTATSVTIADGDNILLFDDSDGDVAKKIVASDLKTYLAPGAGSIAITALDIDGGTALGGASLAQADLFVFDDGGAGTNKSVTFSNLEDSIFGNISGDATVAAGGALTLAANSVSQAQLDDDAVGAAELAANAVVNASVQDGTIKADKLDIDGSTDINAALVDADLIIVDDGAGGTNRKCAMSRVTTYIGANLDSISSTLSMNDSSISNVGDIDCDSISMADANVGLNLDFTGIDSGLSKITVSDGEKASAFRMVSGAVNLMNLDTSMTQMPRMLANMSMNFSGSSAMIGNLGYAIDRRLAIGTDENGANPVAYILADSTASNRMTTVASSSATTIGSASDYLLTNDGSGVVSETVGASKTVVTPRFTVTSATTDVPHLVVKNTNADANPAAFILQKDSASPADNDELGEILFHGDDDGGNETAFASIVAKSTDVTNSEEDGQLSFSALVAGTLRAMTYDADGLTLLNNSGYGKVKAHSFVTYSDETLKTNITPMGDALSTVNKLQGVTYDWKNDGKGDIGFIAQEVAKVVPEVVVSGKDDGLFAMDYARLTAVLVEGMKEQQRQIEDLKNVVVKLSNGKTVQAKVAKVKVPASTELLSDATSEDAEKLLAAKYGWSDED